MLAHKLLAINMHIHKYIFNISGEIAVGKRIYTLFTSDKFTIIEDI